jgi:ferritin-like metal-binding protein YciE
MKDATLQGLFMDHLKDIYYAEKKIVTALPKMASAATSADLKAGFQKHLAETKVHVERLTQVFALMGETPKGKTCPAINGILDEGDETIESYDGKPALDAGLIAAAQAVEHYEMARYGTLRSWAETLQMPEVAELLSLTLAEEEATDEALTELAEATVNEAALDVAA